MRIAVLGSGMVGQALGSRLVELGHRVVMGSRSATNSEAATWADQTGAEHTTFGGAVAAADLAILAVKGEVAISALASIGAGPLAGKTVVDVTNPLDFSAGFPPSVSHPDGLSLGERVQALLPGSDVVKALNTVTAEVMVHPGRLSEATSTFLAGNSEPAKAQVRSLLQEFGWADDQILDLGDITAARGTELYLPLWLRLMQQHGSAVFNIRVVN